MDVITSTISITVHDTLNVNERSTILIKSQYKKQQKKQNVHFLKELKKKQTYPTYPNQLDEAQSVHVNVCMVNKRCFFFFLSLMIKQICFIMSI